MFFPISLLIYVLSCESVWIAQLDTPKYISSKGRTTVWSYYAISSAVPKHSTQHLAGWAFNENKLEQLGLSLRSFKDLPSSTQTLTSTTTELRLALISYMSHHPPG